MFSLSNDTPAEYIAKRVGYFEREVLTASNVAHHFLDLISKRPDSFDECFDLLPQPIRDELNHLASTSDADYYAGQFSILSDPVGTIVDRVEVLSGKPDTITVFIRHGNDAAEPYVVEKSHPFRRSIELLRERLGRSPT
jgi:hypothetical protein